MSKCKSCDAKGCDSCGGRGYVTDCKLAVGEHWGEISGKRYSLILDPGSGTHRFQANPVAREMVDAASDGRKVTLDQIACSDELKQIAMKNPVVRDFVRAAAEGRKFNLNDVACNFEMKAYTSKEMLDLYMMIGYSMGGLAELSYFMRRSMDTCEWKKNAKEQSA